MEGHQHTREALHRELTLAAYNAALLGRVKTFPSFAQVMGEKPAAPRALRGQEAVDAQRAHEALVKRLFNVDVTRGR